MIMAPERFINNCHENECSETIILATPRKKNSPRYNFHEMFEYCEMHKKDIEELTLEEKKKFLI